MRLLLVAAAAGAAVFGLTRIVALGGGEPAAHAAVRPMFGDRSYAQALARLDFGVAANTETAKQRGDEWLVLERLAVLQMARARLTGSFDDYAGGSATLDRAFAVAAPGTGPHLTQASLDFAVHRLARTEQDLARIDRYAVPPDAGDRAEILALRGDIAFYRGDYAGALVRYREAGGIIDGPNIAYRLAVHAWRTGDPDAADREFARTVSMQRFVSAQFLANVELQRGAVALSRGDLEEALAHVRKADGAFPGHWLVQANLAQLAALGGDLDGAARGYRAAIDRSGDPTAMDALAGVYRAMGDAPNSRRWAEKAGAEWKRRLALLPEAAWAHAAEHELAYGDPATALALARRDAAARPYGQAGITLAWALLANQLPEQAIAVLRGVERSGWVSAEQHLAASQAYALTGDGARADEERKKALAINPRALDRTASLLWFGH